MLHHLIERGIPAVLTDLTNDLRYGDICLLQGTDPFVIECKRSRRPNPRARRQRQKLEELSVYYSTDRKRLRNGQESLRVAKPLPDLDYSDALNMALNTASEQGQCLVQPERGLTYAVYAAHKVYNRRWPEVLHGMAFWLNSCRKERDWLSYRPFVLGIKDTDRLLEFINDDLHVLVVVDLGEFSAVAADLGLDFTARDDPDFPFGFYQVDRTNGNDPSGFAISRHMWTRVGLEFESPRRLVENAMREVSIASSSIQPA